MNKYKLTTNQYNELEALFANIWILKHAEANEECKEVLRHNITLIFNELDRLGCPFWVQNRVICLAEVKANQGYYLARLLAKEGIAW